MKKFLLIKLILLFSFLFFFFFLVISVLAVMGFSIGSETVVNNNSELRKQSYLENNNLYAEKYRSLLNKYLFDYGYVSMERIVWYLQVTNNVSDPNTLPTEKWEDAYIKNIDIEEKQMYPTKDMCQKVKNIPFGTVQPPLYNKATLVDLCNENYIEEHNLIYTTMYYAFPYVSPLKKETVTGITSMVNEKRNVDLGLSDSAQASVNFHSGWDMSAPAQTNVYSICDGTIQTVSFTQSENIPFTQQKEPRNSNGNIIKIKCDSTNDIVTYAHLYPNSATSKMIVGNPVAKGQKIASVGTTGQSTGNHLHLGLNTDTGIRLDAFYFIDFSDTSHYTE